MHADESEIHLRIKRLSTPIPWCQSWVDNQGKTKVHNDLLSIDCELEFAELGQLPHGRAWCEACLAAYERVHG